LSLFDLNLCTDPLPLLDLPRLGLGKLLPSFLFGELFGYRQRVLLDLRLEWATLLSLFDLNLGTDPLPLLDLPRLGLCKLLPSFLFRELFVHR